MHCVTEEVRYEDTVLYAQSYSCYSIRESVGSGINENSEMDIFDNISNIIDDEGMIEEGGYDIDEVEEFKDEYNRVKDYAEKLLKKK
jgi:hypothetical protein